MDTANNIPKPLLNEHQVAALAGLSVASIRRRRGLRQLPRAVRIGGSVRYRPEDVAAWLDALPTVGGDVQERRAS